MKWNTAMKIQLSADLEAILKERLVYTSEFINEAIWFALKNDEFKKKWLQNELNKGLEQADRGELYDLEEVIAEIHNSRPTCQKSSSALTPAQI
jgi:predicted transcriptional regulator